MKPKGIIGKIRGLYQLNELDSALYIRKASVISHWFLGALCAYLTTFNIPYALAIMGMFGALEYWNDYCEGKREGCTDWWDAFVVFICGIVLVSILSEVGVI